SSEDDAAIKNALEITKLTDFANRQVISLSGGEKQRAWLAMTLAQSPKILLLDEPTTYLDISHQLEVMDIISDVNKTFSTTIIMVLHDINHARLFSDQILIIKDKKVFAAGNPKKILSAQTLSDIFNVEADIFKNSAGDEIIFPIRRTNSEF
ncbi:MAG: ABC transporter ATP-binding protein, partial [Selenomonadaceae bacterium]|nr:ABC transporter ATP-binding protein [Selenomonadaceae bacterium]